MDKSNLADVAERIKNEVVDLDAAFVLHAREVMKLKAEMRAYNEREARDRRQQHKYAVKHSNRK